MEDRKVRTEIVSDSHRTVGAAAVRPREDEQGPA
jgi:hypothetical protein